MKKYIIKEVRAKDEKLSKKHLKVEIPVDLYAQFKEKCDSNSQTVGAVGKKLILNYLEAKK